MQWRRWPFDAEPLGLATEHSVQSTCMPLHMHKHLNSCSCGISRKHPGQALSMHRFKSCPARTPHLLANNVLNVWSGGLALSHPQIALTQLYNGHPILSAAFSGWIDACTVLIVCRAFIWPSLAPVKDMEVLLLGESMCDPTFVQAFHAVLRLMIDELDVKTFNVAIFGMHLDEAADQDTSIKRQPGKTDTHNSEGASEAEADGLPRNPVIARCSFVSFPPEPSLRGFQQLGQYTFSQGLLHRHGSCRIVSRGSLSSKASDFGALEVLAGASIGHTDPYALHASIQDKFQTPLWTHVAPETMM